MPAGLPDKIFWSPNLLDRLVTVEHPAGLTLLAPARVELKSRKTLPAVLRRTASLRGAALLPLPDFAAVIAVDLQSNDLWTELGVQPHDDARPIEAPAGDELARMGEGSTTETLPVELRSRLGIPWEPSELLLVAIAGEQRSEPRRVILAGPVRRGPGAAPVLRSLDAAPASVVSADGSPPIPATEGISLAVERRDGHVLLHGSYRVPVAAADSRAGFVALHLVFSGSINPWPLPVRLKLAVATEAISTGHFTVEPAALRLSEPRAFTVWAFSRTALGGPALVPAPN